MAATASFWHDVSFIHHLPMKEYMRDRIILLLAAILAATLAIPAAVSASPASTENWVTSWYASPQAVWSQDFILPTNIPSSLQGQTVREVIKVSAGGKRIRLVFSNRYGTTPLEIGEVRVAMSYDGAAIIRKTDTPVTFNGQRSVRIPPGSPMLSDPIPFELAPLRRVAVTSFYPAKTPLTTFHWGGQQTAFVATANVTGADQLKHESVIKGRLFLSALLVDAPAPTRTVVAFGDSITDGNGSTPDCNRRWPDFLAQRFARSNVAVVNAGISGARVLGDRMGENALARFDQDVLAQPGVTAVVLFMGINDIGWPGSPFAPQDPAMTADRLIGGYKHLIARARVRNVRVIGATLLPFEGALQGTPFEGHYSAQKERVRLAVNQWIRSSGAFDSVVDFDAVIRDPDHPARMRPVYDSGDHLHPGNAGYSAMANAFDLDMLFGK